MTIPTTTSIQELIDRLNQVDESNDIEAKRSSAAIGKSTLETVSAFSNEPGLGGGYLLLGVSEDQATHRFFATGVQDSKKFEQELSTLCAASFNRAIRPRIWTETIDGQPIVAAFIPEASAPEKPVFVKAQGMQHGTYRRVGSTDQRCSEDDLRVLFRAGDKAAYEDSLVTDSAEEDLDPDVVATYRKQLLDTNPATELREATTADLIQAVGGGRRVDGQLVPTVAGVLLFGRRLSLRRLFPQIRIDYIRVPGTRWVPDTDHRYDSIDIRDPLLLAFRRAYQAIIDDLPRSFVLEPGSPQRRDRAAVPETVVREALVNALTHRDYRTPSATQVIRYSDRIEIRNPGHSLVGEEQFGQPGSFPRNPRIADVFREMGLAENKGTGIEAMRRAMRRADLTPPVFDSDPRNDLFMTTLWLHSLLDESEVAWLAMLKLDLTTAQRQALVVARRVGAVTNSALRDLTGLDPLQARRELHGLRDAALLIMEGDRGGAYYVLGPAAKVAMGSPGGRREPGPVVHSSPADPGANDEEDDRQGLAADGQGLVPDRRGLAPDRQGLAAVRGGLSAAGFALPPELQAAVERLGDRPRQAPLREVIQRLCAWRPLRPGELGAILSARPDNLTRRHLSPMVDEGRLERTHPENLSHPDQAYRARQATLPVPVTDGPNRPE